MARFFRCVRKGLPLLFILVFLCDCEARPMQAQAFALNTVLTVTLYGGSAQDAQDALAVADQAEARLSAHKTDSQIARLNREGTLQADAQTAALLTKALTLCEATGGAFDITLGGVSALWNFTEQVALPDPVVPEETAIQQALTHTGYTGLQIDGNTVTLTDPLAQVDLGAIAKGAVGEEMRALLKEKGVKSAILNLGGMVMTLGLKNGEPWEVAIDSPFQSGEIVGVLRVGETAISTSSGAQRFFEKDGVRYHHILDPQTGYPAQSGVSSVTVLASDGATADALSTALFVAGYDKGCQILAHFEGASAVFVMDTGEILLCGEPPFTKDTRFSPA